MPCCPGPRLKLVPIPEPGPSAGQRSELVGRALPGDGRGVGEPQGRGRGASPLKGAAKTVATPTAAAATSISFCLLLFWDDPEFWAQSGPLPSPPSHFSKGALPEPLTSGSPVVLVRTRPR